MTNFQFPCNNTHTLYTVTVSSTYTSTCKLHRYTSFTTITNYSPVASEPPRQTLHHIVAFFRLVKVINYLFSVPTNNLFSPFTMAFRKLFTCQCLLLARNMIAPSYISRGLTSATGRNQVRFLVRRKLLSLGLFLEV